MPIFPCLNVLTMQVVGIFCLEYDFLNEILFPLEE